MSHLPPSPFPPQFKLPTSAPPTTKPVTPKPVTMVTATLTTTTMTTSSLMITSTPSTVAATQRLTTPVLRTFTVQLPTTSPFLEVTTPPQPPVGTGRMPVVTSGFEASPTVTTSAINAAPDAVVPSENLDPAMPLFIPPPDPDSSTLDMVTAWSPRTPHEAKGALSMVEASASPSEVTALSTPFPVVEPVDSEPFQHLTQPPSPGPSQYSQIETGRQHPNPKVPLWTPEETDVPTESALQPGNDTASFSAATLLSGDGEIDHTPQSYPHLLGPDSDLDYQYDPADGFLPVSLTSIHCSQCTTSSCSSHFTSCPSPSPFRYFFFASVVNFFPFVTFPVSGVNGGYMDPSTPKGLGLGLRNLNDESRC